MKLGQKIVVFGSPRLVKIFEDGREVADLGDIPKGIQASVFIENKAAAEGLNVEQSGPSEWTVVKAEEPPKKIKEHYSSNTRLDPTPVAGFNEKDSA